MTVGDKNFAEQFVLGQLYAQALRAQGFSVNINQNIGPTDVTVQALKNGSLTVYPEYLNTFNTAVAGYHHDFSTLLDAYQGGPALRADPRHAGPGPHSVLQHRRACGHRRLRGAEPGAFDRRPQPPLGAASPSAGRPSSRPGLPACPTSTSTTASSPSATGRLAVGDQYAALNNGTIQAADVNSTDGQLATGDYVLMRDPRRTFGWGNVVPVVSAKAVAAEGSAFTDTIVRVDDQLDTDTIRRLNYAVDDRRPGSRGSGAVSSCRPMAC